MTLARFRIAFVIVAWSLAVAFALDTHWTAAGAVFLPGLAVAITAASQRYAQRDES